MAYANPDNGWAYSPIELTAWAKFTENWQVMAKDLEKPYEVHLRLADRHLPTVAGITDKRAAELIERAIDAEICDPDPFVRDERALENLPEPNDPNPYGGGA